MTELSKLCENLDDVIKDTEDMISILSKSEVTSLMSPERAEGARIAYCNCLVKLKYISNLDKKTQNQENTYE